MQAIVLVGGKGTRLRPLTERVPKPALTLVDRPFLAYMIEWLAGHGVTDVVLACGFLPDVLREALAGEEERAGVRIRYAVEPEPLGTAGAIRFAADQLGDELDERFLALNGDVLTDLDLTALLRAHEEWGAAATIGLHPVEDSAAFGLVGRGERGEVLEFLEKTGEPSGPDGVLEAAGFVEGWLESRGIEVATEEVRGLPVLKAEVGPEDAPTVVLHGHLDVVPGLPGQFDARVEGERLYGRGAYDMKGALAAMLATTAALRESERLRVRLGIVGDEESEEEAERGSDALVDGGFVGDFAITGEPTDLQIGVEAKGVLALRLEVSGVAAHGATPWLGDNAVLKAHDVFRSIESLPFARHSSELFDRPSINLGRILGGDALNKVPDRCAIDVDIRYLPDQDPEAVLAQVRGLPDVEARPLLSRPPAVVDRRSPFVQCLREAASAHHEGEPMSVGRDGASDAVSFLRVGVPAVEFGPLGEGHHGPAEWVSIPSLVAYRQALEQFLRALPERLEG